VSYRFPWYYCIVIKDYYRVPQAEMVFLVKMETQELREIPANLVQLDQLELKDPKQ